MLSENIQFSTSYNVNINYPKASLLFRLAAFAIDAIIQVILMTGFKLLLGNNILADVMIIFILCFWNLFFEIILNGQSIGKLALGIRIISLNGDNAGLKALILRWSLKIIDVLLTLGMGAILSILSTRLNQRLGDIVAGTTLVETRSNKNLNFSYFDKLSRKDYTITYPDVIRYSEEEMLLLKEVYNRAMKYDNKENNDLLSDVCKKLTSDFEMPLSSVKDKKTFLKTVIEDYIMATR